MKKTVFAVALCMVVFLNACSADLQKDNNKNADKLQTEQQTDAQEKTGNQKVVDSGVCGKNLTWTFYENGELVISGNGEMLDLDEHTVQWKELNEDILSIRFENGVTNVSSNVFSGLPNLRSVALADTVKEIGDSSFERCKCLTSVKLSNNLESIGERAFQECKTLIDIKLPAGLKKLGSNAFSECKNLEKVDIPEQILYVGHGVFDDFYINKGVINLLDCTYEDIVKEFGKPKNDWYNGPVYLVACARERYSTDYTNVYCAFEDGSYDGFPKNDSKCISVITRLDNLLNAVVAFEGFEKFKLFLNSEGFDITYSGEGEMEAGYVYDVVGNGIRFYLVTDEKDVISYSDCGKLISVRKDN